MLGSSPTGATVAIGQWQSGRLWLCSRGRKMSGGHLLCADRSGAETDSPWSPHGWVCPAARLLWSSGPCSATTETECRPADCKSVTKKHRRFESCPIHFLFACPRGLWCLSVPLRSSQNGCPPDILRPAKVVCVKRTEGSNPSANVLEMEKPIPLLY